MSNQRFNEEEFTHHGGLMHVEINGDGTAQLEVKTGGGGWIPVGDPLPKGTHLETLLSGAYRLILASVTAATRHQ